MFQYYFVHAKEEEEEEVKIIGTDYEKQGVMMMVCITDDGP
jgi:hypothetical protein